MSFDPVRRRRDVTRGEGLRPRDPRGRELAAEHGSQRVEHGQGARERRAAHQRQPGAAPHRSERHHAPERDQRLPRVLLILARDAQTERYRSQRVVDQRAIVPTVALRRRRGVHGHSQPRGDRGEQQGREDLARVDFTPVFPSRVDRIEERVQDLALEAVIAIGRRELGDDDVEHSGLEGELERVPAGAAAAEPIELLEDPRRRGFGNLGPRLAERGERPVLDREAQTRGELDRAEDPNRIFPEADDGIADRPHQAPAEVAQAVGMVDDRLGVDVIEERVDREVAPQRVLFRRAEDVVVPDEQVVRVVRGYGFALGLRELGAAIRQVARAKRRDLDDLPVLEVDVGEPEATPDDAAVGEQTLDLARRRARRDVEVFRVELEEEVADAAADEVGRIIESRKPFDDANGVGVQVLEGDRMMDDFGTAMDRWRGGRSALGGRDRCRRHRFGAQALGPAREQGFDLLQNHAGEL
jgi:hypothetical protein